MGMMIVRLIVLAAATVPGSKVQTAVRIADDTRHGSQYLLDFGAGLGPVTVPADAAQIDAGRHSHEGFHLLQAGD